jgi:hypothetical protein
MQNWTKTSNCRQNVKRQGGKGWNSQRKPGSATVKKATSNTSKESHQEEEIHEDVKEERGKLVAFITIIPHEDLNWRHHASVQQQYATEEQHSWHTANIQQIHPLISLVLLLIEAEDCIVQATPLYSIIYGYQYKGCIIF